MTHYDDAKETVKFPEMIFLGAGEHSKEICKQLHDRLAEGLSWLGGAQQPQHASEICTEEEWESWNNEIQHSSAKNIMSVIGDIARALGCKTKRTDDGGRFILEIENKKYEYDTKGVD